MPFESPWRRITTWLSLLGYAFVGSGLPLPVGVVSRTEWGLATADSPPEKDESHPFPCMDKPCGCATAEQCFASCCCHTPTERLAWARAHDIEVAVLASLEERVAAEASSRSVGCAVATSASSCSPHESFDLDGPEICGDYRSLAADPVSYAPESAAEPPVASPRAATGRVVVLRAMLACGGIASAWSTATVSVLPPPRSTGDLHPLTCVGWIILDDQSCLGELSAPDAPPPRA